MGARHQFVGLDGLRGIAALSVVMLHYRIFFGEMGEMLLNRHQYLAVDFFLLLSGFVLAHAYDARLRQPGSRLPFLRDRMIRLHPMLVLSALIGGAGLALPGGIESFPVGQSAMYALTATIPLPLPAGPYAFPANFPTWSLFWELLLNVALALVAIRLSTRWAIVLLAGLVAATVAIALAYQSIDIGTDFEGLFAAGPRLATSFTLGVIVLHAHRRGILAADRRRWWVTPALLLCFFGMAKDAPGSLAFDLAAMLLVFPLLLLAAAGGRTIAPPLARFSGGISYPLYVLHIPLAVWMMFVLNQAEALQTWWAGGAILIAVLALSYAIQRLYDEPLRAALRRRYGSDGHRRSPDAQPAST